MLPRKTWPRPWQQRVEYDFGDCGGHDNDGGSRGNGGDGGGGGGGGGDGCRGPSTRHIQSEVLELGCKSLGRARGCGVSYFMS